MRKTFARRFARTRQRDGDWSDLEIARRIAHLLMLADNPEKGEQERANAVQQAQYERRRSP
jgi:hypothetical protein